MKAKSKMTLELPAQSNYFVLVRGFLSGAGPDFKEEDLNLLEVALEDASQFFCPGSDNRLNLRMEVEGSRVLIGLKDNRQQQSEAASGPWKSPHKDVFTRAEYEISGHSGEMVLTWDLQAAPGDSEDDAPLPLPHHKVLSGAALAG